METPISPDISPDLLLRILRLHSFLLLPAFAHWAKPDFKHTISSILNSHDTPPIPASEINSCGYTGPLDWVTGRFLVNREIKAISKALQAYGQPGPAKSGPSQFEPPPVITVLNKSPNMPDTVGLHVAIYKAGGVYKHWSLFIDGATKEEKIILHIVGSSTRFRFEMRNSNAHDSETLVEMIHLYDVDASKVEAIKEAADNAVIHNESPGYNCQDYILELLDVLETEKIINASNVKYKKNKKVLKGKQEGLE